jgi:hypothetical protein
MRSKHRLRTGLQCARFCALAFCTTLLAQQPISYQYFYDADLQFVPDKGPDIAVLAPLACTLASSSTSMNVTFAGYTRGFVTAAFTQ